MKRLMLSIFAFAIGGSVYATPQNDTLSNIPNAMTMKPDAQELQTIDQILVDNYKNHFCFTTDRQVLNAYGYSEDQVPTFTPEVIQARLAVLDKETPFDLVYNPTVQGFIDLYSIRRRDISTKVLGMSELYFPIFEEALAKHGIPLEMKYLAIVESALNPGAISSAGAGGLWQFMVGTGKMYDLDVNSYQDERFDPYKATEAACLYLKFLYKTFGDWQLALAAYNSGPGNVNKAIRRSGGKRDFWEIKNYLPKETQGYVPAFIAVNYVMNYAAEHNIYPNEPIATFYETDSVTVKDRVDFATLASLIGMPLEQIAFLNSTYKLKEIPNNGKKHYLILPTDKIGLFITNEALVYEKCSEQKSAGEALLTSNSTESKSTEGGTKKVVYEDSWKNHKVKKGESLGTIADKYDVTLAQLKKWNHIKGSVIHPGQTLKIQTKVKRTVVEPEEENTAQNKTETSSEVKQEETSAQNNTTEQKQEVAPKKEKPQYKYYTIQPGDTLYKIASKYDGVTVNSIKSLNSGLKENKLVVGQKIKIKQI